MILNVSGKWRKQKDEWANSHFSCWTFRTYSSSTSSPEASNSQRTMLSLDDDESSMTGFESKFPINLPELTNIPQQENEFGVSYQRLVVHNAFHRVTIMVCFSYPPYRTPLAVLANRRVTLPVIATVTVNLHRLRHQALVIRCLKLVLMVSFERE